MRFQRLFVWLIVLAACPTAVFAAGPKGIVVFISDDQAQTDVGCYGNAAIHTPHCDKLAAEGIRFDKAFLTTSSCSPSRSSILTGRYPHCTGAEDLHTPLPAEQKTIAQYLRNAGWYCAAVGKWHLGKAEEKNWDAVVGSPPQSLAANTLKTFAARDKSKPFFFWVASTDPHRTYQPGAFDPPHDPAKVIVPPFLPDDPRVREDLALYYDEIARFDGEVGKIVAALEAEEVADDTLFVYMTDNGMPFSRAKTSVYDSGIATPFIVRWKNGIQAGQTSSSLISSVDLSPTLLDLAGVKQDSMQGVSFAKVLQDPKAMTREKIFAEANWHDYEQFTRAIRTDRYKLIHNFYNDVPGWTPADSVNSPTWEVVLEWQAAGKLTALQAQPLIKPRAVEELYDLRQDPNEIVNLVDDPNYQDELKKLRAELEAWRSETDDALPKERRADGFTRDGKMLKKP